MDWVLGVMTMFGPYFSISAPTCSSMAREIVRVEMITAIARINPIRLRIARPFLRERFLVANVSEFIAPSSAMLISLELTIYCS